MGGVTRQIEMGLSFLEKSCRPITGFQNSSIGTSRDTLKPTYYPEDIFTSLIALDYLGDSLSFRCRSILRKFVAPARETGVLNFNKFRHILPDDVEDTALYHYIYLRDGLIPHDNRILDIARVIYLNKARNGAIQLYYSSSHEDRDERLDAGCQSNAIRFLYHVGCCEEAMETEDYLYDWLVSEKYLEGTRYYASPDTFLCFCSGAVIHNSRAQQRFEKPLTAALKKRMEDIDRNEWPLDFSLRILALANLNKLGSPEFQQPVRKMVTTLKGMQDQATGAFKSDSLYKLGRALTFLGGEDISTIFAVAALKAYEKHCEAFSSDETKDETNSFCIT